MAPSSDAHLLSLDPVRGEMESSVCKRSQRIFIQKRWVGLLQKGLRRNITHSKEKPKHCFREIKTVGISAIFSFWNGLLNFYFIFRKCMFSDLSVVSSSRYCFFYLNSQTSQNKTLPSPWKSINLVFHSSFSPSLRLWEASVQTLQKYEHISQVNDKLQYQREVIKQKKMRLNFSLI